MDSGRIFPAAVHAIADRIEKIDGMTLHFSPAVVARVLTEFANTPPRRKSSDPESSGGDVLPVRDHYWLLHDGEKYARHGTEDCNGVLVFDCQERAEQFMLTVGKALPDFKPVKVTPAAFLEEVKRVGAFTVAEGSLKVRVCEISKEE